MHLNYQHDSIEVGLLLPGEVFYYLGQYYLRIRPVQDSQGVVKIAVTLTSGMPSVFPREQRVTPLRDACLTNKVEVAHDTVAADAPREGSGQGET